MEKELEELSVFFDGKKNVINLLATLKGKYCMNDDIITMIYNNFSLGRIGGNYEYITSNEEGDSLMLEA
jgi:hypothetical protein